MVANTAPQRTLDMSPEAVRKRKQRMLAEGPKVVGGYTTKAAHATASRWVGSVGEPVNIEAEAEILVQDDGSGRVLVNINTIRGSARGPIERRDFFECDEHEADELEAVAVALTEAVRLGKERGILPNASRKAVNRAGAIQ